MPSLFRRLVNLILGKPAPPPVRPAPPAPDPATPAEYRAEFLALLNRERVRTGRPPMQADPKLEAAAQAWAESMARTNILTHGDTSRGEPFSRLARVYPGLSWDALNENVAEGQRDASTAFADWMSSDDHRATMMGDYNRVGLGRSGLYWASDFARVGR